MKGPAELAHGPLLIGFVFNVLLFGIMVTQMYIYVTTFHKDPRWIKIYVALLFLADTLNVIFMFIYIYNTLVVHFDEVQYLGTADWVFATDPAMTAIIGSMVQFFFAFRVRVLNKSLWVVVTICVLSATALLCGIGTSAAIAFVPQFSEFQRFKVPVMIWLLSAAVADVIITTVLVDYLRKHKTGYSATDDRLDKLMKLTIQTGMLTSIWAVIDCLVYLLDPTGTHLIFNVPLSKLYSNALMSTLNSRANWKNPQSADSNPRRASGTGMVSTNVPEFNRNILATDTRRRDSTIKTGPITGNEHTQATGRGLTETIELPSVVTRGSAAGRMSSPRISTRSRSIDGAGDDDEEELSPSSMHFAYPASPPAIPQRSPPQRAGSSASVTPTAYSPVTDERGEKRLPSVPPPGEVLQDFGGDNDDAESSIVVHHDHDNNHSVLGLDMRRPRMDDEETGGGGAGRGAGYRGYR